MGNPIENAVECKNLPDAGLDHPSGNTLKWDGDRTWGDRASGCLHTKIDGEINFNAQDGEPTQSSQARVCKKESGVGDTKLNDTNETNDTELNDTNGTNGTEATCVVACKRNAQKRMTCCAKQGVPTHMPICKATTA